MKIRIIVSYQPRYRRGHQWDFVPPVTGMHLAALTPPGHELDLVHQQVRQPQIDAWPDLVAVSFFSGFTSEAYRVADRYRAAGIPVVLGGPHVTFWPEEALRHGDAIVLGEAESVWSEVIRDFAARTPRQRYRGVPQPLDGLPTPRYDLLESRFLVPRVVQATRGCPFHCTFCSVPGLSPGFRTRPLPEVIRDIASSRFDHFWQDKLVWFWDDNLLVQRRWAKELLHELAMLDRYWLTQASIDLMRDPELMRGLSRSGCIGIFLGIESLEAEGLRLARKTQNRVEEYREAIERLHDLGICVMAGFIAGFDHQTPQGIEAMAEQLNRLGVDVPFLSVLTPFRGTQLYDELRAAGRLLEDCGWGHYNGYNVAFQPARMTPRELRDAHRRLWRAAFGPRAVAERIARARHLSAGGKLLSLAMNGFYGLKALTGNLPADATDALGSIDHHRQLPREQRRVIS